MSDRDVAPDRARGGFGWLKGFGLLCLLALSGCMMAPWDSAQLRDHPLVGKVWDVRAQAFIEEPVLLARLKDASLVLLGESHDNLDHHRIQLRVLQSQLAAGLRPALVMEQFDIEHQGQIDKALKSPDIDAEGLADAGQMNRKGWDWDQYRPLVEAALKAGLPVVAANLSRAEARKVASDGFSALGANRSEALAIERAWNDERQKTMSELIIQGHCGSVPDDLLPRLVRSQRARDAIMAERLAAQRERGAVAILGRGHVRKDLGAPIYLAATAGGLSVTTVGIVEVAAGREDPRQYLARTEVGDYDYLWFTPRAARKDPCAGFSFKASGSGSSPK